MLDSGDRENAQVFQPNRESISISAARCAFEVADRGVSVRCRSAAIQHAREFAGANGEHRLLLRLWISVSNRIQLERSPGPEGWPAGRSKTFRTSGGAAANARSFRTPRGAAASAKTFRTSGGKGARGTRDEVT